MIPGSFYQNYREIRLLVIHCSATRCDRSFPVEALRRAHLHRGFASIGYHFYITRDGEVHPCRPVHQIGAHATGWNAVWTKTAILPTPAPTPSVVPSSTSCVSSSSTIPVPVSWATTSSATRCTRRVRASMRRRNMRNYKKRQE